MDVGDLIIAAGGSRAENFINRVWGKDCRFVCVISYTETCEIPGITVAGANPDLVKYTPPADAEFLYHGRPRCIDVIPATPDGKPTPAVITRAALRSAGIPLVVVDAGSKVKPDVPHHSLGLGHGRNIARGRALESGEVRNAFDRGTELGRSLSKDMPHLVVGESIPGGTTTAMGVLLAMGIDARYKISSSMPENPHDLKLATIEQGMRAAGVDFGTFANKPVEAVAHFGDPMIPSVAGIAVGASETASVTLAGGTQMAAVLSFIAASGKATENIAVGTTRYILDDASSDIVRLVSSVADVPVLACDPLLDKSSKPGLRAYAGGFVKEGAGAGGACVAAVLKSMGEIDGSRLLAAIEEEYELTIERSR